MTKGKPNSSPAAKLQAELDSARVFQEGHDAGLLGLPKQSSDYQLVYDAGYVAGQKQREKVS